MKIAIIGYSGAGKSTLARKLGEKYGVDVLHLDSVHFLPGWVERERADEQKIVEDFLDSHAERGWVVDGNYTKLSYERRIDEADLVIMMLLGRFACFRRAYLRSRKYKGQTRPDMGDGCAEKFDWEFATWILWRGRSKRARERYRTIREKYPDKTVVLKSQREIDRFKAMPHNSTHAS